MKPLWHEDYWSVQISWSRPKEYDRLLLEGSPHDKTANLYLISARYGKSASKTVYIGQTYQQWVSKRLSQDDHKKRRDSIISKYPRHKLYVSHGVILIRNGVLTRKRVGEIKQILIYSNDLTHAHNIKNYWKHEVSTSYRIENRGSKCTLPKEIALGVFVKY